MVSWGPGELFLLVSWSIEDVIITIYRIRRVSTFPRISLDQEDYQRVYIFVDLAGGLHVFIALPVIGIIFYNFRSAGTAHEWHTRSDAMLLGTSWHVSHTRSHVCISPDMHVHR